MPKDGIEHDLEALLTETGTAHHQAFAATNGADPQWATWYSAYLRVRLNGLLGASFGEAEIAELLTAAEKERAKHFPDAEWAHYYAEFFLERYV